MSSDEHKTIETLTRIEQKLDTEIAFISKIEGKVNSDITGSLSRLESKVEALSDTISKVVYGLLAIVAATVGVEFLPNSPIDWYGATLFAQRFFSIASLLFLSLMLYKTSFNGNSENRRWLATGLITLSIILGIGTYDTMILRSGLGFYIGSFLRIIYTTAFAKYAWSLTDKPEPKDC